MAANLGGGGIGGFNDSNVAAVANVVAPYVA